MRIVKCKLPDTTKDVAWVKKKAVFHTTEGHKLSTHLRENAHVRALYSLSLSSSVSACGRRKSDHDHVILDDNVGCAALVPYLCLILPQARHATYFDRSPQWEKLRNSNTLECLLDGSL